MMYLITEKNNLEFQLSIINTRIQRMNLQFFLLNLQNKLCKNIIKICLSFTILLGMVVSVKFD